MKEEAKEIGGFLREERETLGMTEVQLADMLQLKIETVRTWEEGKKLPDRQMLPLLAECLQVKMTDVVMGRRLDDNEAFSVKESDELLKRVITLFSY